MEFTQQIIFLLSLLVLAFISIYTFLNRRVAGALPFFIQIIVTLIWTAASLFEFNSDSLEAKVFWRNIEQIGIFIGPIASIMFAIEYSGQLKLKKYAYVIMTIPITALLLIFTDRYHHIMRVSCRIEEHDIFGKALVVQSTGIGRAFVVFNFCLPILSILILLYFIKTVSPYYRKRVFLVITSILLLLFTSWLRVTYLEKNGFFIPGAVLYTPSALLLFYSTFKYKFFSVSPVARDKIFDVMNEGIIVMDLQNTIIDINPSAVKLLKDKLQIHKELLGAFIQDAFIGHPQALELALSRGEKAIEIEIHHNDTNSYLSFSTYPLFINHNEQIGSVIIMSDITDKKKYELYLQEKAYRDSLTGLFNRSGFNKELEKQIHSTAEPVAICMIDVDRFKAINDTYGHLNGDRVLQHLARVLQNELRGQNIIGRFGGEEFAVLLPNTSKLEAVMIMEAIRKKIEKDTVLMQEGQWTSYTISIGVNDNSSSEADFATLLHEADLALYEAKRTSRNCTIVYMG